MESGAYPLVRKYVHQNSRTPTNERREAVPASHADFLDRSDTVVNAYADVRDHIAQQGILTQHETQTSNGVLDPYNRRDYEDKVFPRRSTNPRYGTVPRDARDMKNTALGYGDDAYTLKPHLKPLTTYTHGDSLDTHEPFSTDEIRAGKINLQPPHNEYIEAQVHAPIHPDDIQDVTAFAVGYGRLPTPPDHMGKPWAVVNINEEHQPSLFEHHDKPYDHYTKDEDGEDVLDHQKAPYYLNEGRRAYIPELVDRSPDYMTWGRQFLRPGAKDY